MSHFEEVKDLLIRAFYKHAGTDGDSTTLSKQEMMNLLKTEFRGILGNASDPAKVEEFFIALDEDRSGSLDFEEYKRLVDAFIMILMK